MRQVRNKNSLRRNDPHEPNDIVYQTTKSWTGNVPLCENIYLEKYPCPPGCDNNNNKGHIKNLASELEQDLVERMKNTGSNGILNWNNL